MTKQQELKCLFGSHEYFQSGCIRQCIHCKLTQIFDVTQGSINNPKWLDTKISPDDNYDLKEISKIAAQKALYKQYPSIGIQSSASYTYKIITTSSSNACYYPIHNITA